MRHGKSLKGIFQRHGSSACIAFFMGSRAADAGFYEDNEAY
jgi:hypothetical protein